MAESRSFPEVKPVSCHVPKHHLTVPVKYDATDTWAGWCRRCNWVGPERLTRVRAERDGEDHYEEMESK